MQTKHPSGFYQAIYYSIEVYAFRISAGFATSLRLGWARVDHANVLIHGLCAPDVCCLYLLYQFHSDMLLCTTKSVQWYILVRVKRCSKLRRKDVTVK